MKKISNLFVCLVVTITVFAQKEIKAGDARNNIGETVKICTTIMEVAFDENAKGSPTWLYSTTDTSRSPITFIIWGEKRKNFDYKPEKDLKEREVCISGTIALLKEKPVLVVERQSQIKIR